MRQLLAREFDRFRILVERENIRARFEKTLGVTAAAAVPSTTRVAGRGASNSTASIARTGR